MLKYQIVGLKKLQAAVYAAPQDIYIQQRIALTSSVELIKRTVVSLSARGPGHFGYHMVDRWVAFLKAASAGGVSSSQGIVRTDAPQAKWGEYGTKPHDIRPTSAQALQLYGGVTVSVVHHPGEKARHTLRKAYRISLPTIRGYFVGALLKSAESMATKGD